ncbi:DNA primase family protein [Paraburkholderia sediminicola]|uniref:DNA primase family protein n=1 Tax=Paraburkholderia sediminicola TaxID=458836 RepID=UPI0038B7E38A
MLHTLSSPVKGNLTEIAVAFGQRDLGAVKQQALTWDELVEVLVTPRPAPINHAEYLALPKDQRNALKKRDRFMLPGTCRHGRRDDAHLDSRSAATLDVDEDAATLYGSLCLGCVDVPFAYAWHTTRSHTEEAPRLRIVVPFSRAVSPAEYRRIVPALGAAFGVTYDPASIKPSQMMFLPVRNVGAPFESGSSFGTGFVEPDTLISSVDVVERASEPAPDVADFGDLDPNLEEMLRNPAKQAELMDAALFLARRESGYHDWVRRAHNTRGLGEFGFTVFEVYSRAMPDFDPTCDLRAKWQSCPGGRSGYKAIFKDAIAAGWDKAVEADYASKVGRDDLGNANLIVQQTAGDLRFVGATEQWLQWTGDMWVPDAFRVFAKQCATRVAEHYAREAAKLEKESKNPALDDKEAKQILKAAQGLRAWETQCRNRSRREAMLAEAQTLTELPAEKLDTDPYLFGVANGVIDLRTGALRPAARDEFVTKRSPVRFVPTARRPRFEKLVDEITGEPIPPAYNDDGAVDPATVGRYRKRPALAAYLKRLLGYLMTGFTVEQKMFLFVGAGSNGKSLLLDLVQWLLADYAATVPAEFLMMTKNRAGVDAANPILAGLFGARLALSVEAENGHRFDEGRIKNLTGSDTIKARFLHANPIEFSPTHKHVLLTNEKPAIDHLDAAIKGRLHLVPFDRRWNRPDEADRDPSLPDGEKGLAATLRGEAEGVLAWLVEGAVEYLKVGLRAPDEVVLMTRDYFDAQDPIARWLDGYESCDPKDGTRGSVLLEAFNAWCERSARFRGVVENKTAFANRLAKRGVAKSPRKDVAIWGLRAKSHENADSEDDFDLV